MGNILHRENNSANHLKVKTEDIREKPLSTGKIKRRFEHERELLIHNPSDTKKFVKKRSKFYRTLLTNIFSYTKNKTELINENFPAFKDRKLISQALTLIFFYLSDKNIKRSAVTLTSQRKILNLSLCFNRSSEMTKQGVNFLASRLRRTFLSELNISFVECSKISEEIFSTLFAGLKHLNNLSNFTLDLYNIKPLELIAIKELVSSLKNMIRLKRLKISIKECLVEDEAIEELFSGLGKLKHILNLSFDFSNPRNHVNDNILKNVPKMLTSLKCLTSLDLKLNFNFSLRNQENLALIHVSSGLKSLTSLKSLTFSLLPWGLKFTEDGVGSLSEALKEIKSLEKLGLKFSGKDFKKQCYDKLSLGFNDLKKLKHLSLYFDTIDILDQDIEDFSLIFKDMKTLNDLRLMFRTSHKFDKKVLYRLYENLKEVSSLKYLYLRIHLEKALKEEEKKNFISKFGDVKVEMKNF